MKRRPISKSTADKVQELVDKYNKMAKELGNQALITRQHRSATHLRKKIAEIQPVYDTASTCSKCARKFHTPYGVKTHIRLVHGDGNAHPLPKADAISKSHVIKGSGFLESEKAAIDHLVKAIPVVGRQVTELRQGTYYAKLGRALAEGSMEKVRELFPEVSRQMVELAKVHMSTDQQPPDTVHIGQFKAITKQLNRVRRELHATRKALVLMSEYGSTLDQTED